MKVLGIDTSSKVGSVAVRAWNASGSGSTLSERSGGVDARHGETLLPLVRGALEDADTSLADLDLLAIGCGPGSFTGTRIGLAAAKGFVIGARMPLVGVSSFVAIARRVARDLHGSRVAVVGDAGRGGVFVALHEWSVGEPVRTLMAPRELRPEQVMQELAVDAPTLFVGTGIRTYPFIGEGFQVDAKYDMPLAREVADEARLRFVATGPDDAATLQPNYVRPCDAKLPS